MIIVGAGTFIYPNHLKLYTWRTFLPDCLGHQEAYRCVAQISRSLAMMGQNWIKEASMIFSPKTKIEQIVL